MSAIGPGSAGSSYSAAASQPAFGQGQSSGTTNFSGQTQDTPDSFTPSSKKPQQQPQS